MKPLRFPGGLVKPTSHWPEAHPGDRTPTTLTYEVFQMPRQPLCHMLDLAKFPPPDPIVNNNNLSLTLPGESVY